MIKGIYISELFLGIDNKRLIISINRIPWMAKTQSARFFSFKFASKAHIWSYW
jgi:hypothetical protein